MSRDVIFNEQVMQKDKQSTKYESTCPEVKKSKIVQSTYFPMNKLQKSDREDQENVTLQMDPHIPVIKLKRSSINIKQPQRCFPSLYYILLTDRSEPESYEEAMQVDE